MCENENCTTLPTTMRTTTVSYAWSKCNFELDREPETGIRVMEGEKITFKCGVKQKDWDDTKNWAVCTWTRMWDHANCTFEYKKLRYSSMYEVYQLCHGMKEDPRFLGSSELYEGIKNPVCGITFRQIMLEDAGQWKCDLHYYDNVHLNACTATHYTWLRQVKKSPVVVRPIPVIEVGKPGKGGCSTIKYNIIQATSKVITSFLIFRLNLKVVNF